MDRARAPEPRHPDGVARASLSGADMTMLQSPAPEGAEAALPAPAGAQASGADGLKDAFARQRRAVDRHGGVSPPQRRAPPLTPRARAEAQAAALSPAAG